MLHLNARHRLLLSHNREGLVDPSGRLAQPVRLFHRILL